MWQQFQMPQVQLPIFPAGVTHINSEVAFEERDGKVYYFNGHLPVFVHEKDALSTFRLFSSQLVINGNATQAEISRGFGVPLVTVLSVELRGHLVGERRTSDRAPGQSPRDAMTNDNLQNDRTTPDKKGVAKVK